MKEKLSELKSALEIEKAALKRKLNYRAHSEMKGNLGPNSQRNLGYDHRTADARGKSPKLLDEGLSEYLSNGYIDKMEQMGGKHQWKLNRNHKRYQKEEIPRNLPSNISVLNSVRNVNT